VRLAEEAGGKDHHFRVVQAPFNLAMTEALTRRNQRVGGEVLSLLAAAERLHLTVMTSAALLQGQLSRRLPAALAEVLSGLGPAVGVLSAGPLPVGSLPAGKFDKRLETDAQRAIQFARSAPGVTTALVGMKQAQHAEENLATARVAPLDHERFAQLFRETASRQ
jgi:aryl-alcohol dehydrogenase-like predicted oxidoreductase